MTIYQPYTYLIGWTTLDKWYYGVRYAKGCSPDDLWVKYFTSSPTVKEIRENHGEPDVIQVRKIFDCAEKAKKWENEVLRRCKVIYRDKWLNKTASYAFPIRDIRGDKNPMKDPKIAKKVGETLRTVMKDVFQSMTPEERSLRYGLLGEDNPFYGKEHSEESKSKISESVKKSSFHDRIECHICKRQISKINMSRHLFSCSNGKEGTKANANRKGIVMKKRDVKTICITDGITTKRIPKNSDVPIPEGWRKGRHWDRKT